MSEFVLDCSVTVSWLFADEASPQTDALLNRLKETKALVPTLWPLEIGNVLTQSERRKRIAAAQVTACVELLGRLPIEVDAASGRRALREVLSLARAQTLTTYDAAYLELAMRHGIPLATRDKALLRASGRVGVRTVPD